MMMLVLATGVVVRVMPRMRKGEATVLAAMMISLLRVTFWGVVVRVRKNFPGLELNVLPAVVLDGVLLDVELSVKKVKGVLGVELCVELDVGLGVAQRHV